MKPSTYNLLLGFFALIVLIVPFTGKLYDGRDRWYKRLKFRGWLVCVAFLVSIYVNYDKDLQSDKDEQAKADTADFKRNESNALLTKTFVTTLAQYGLKYDSTQKIITKQIQESAKKGNKINPELSICNIVQDTATNEYQHIQVTMCSHQATAYNLKIKIYKVIEVDNKFIYIKSPEIGFTIVDLIEANKDVTAGIRIINNPQISKIYLLAIGTYTNISKEKFKYREFLLYDRVKKIYGNPSNPSVRKKVLKLFSNNGII
jgi:hypothetical protein